MPQKLPREHSQQPLSRKLTETTPSTPINGICTCSPPVRRKGLAEQNGPKDTITNGGTTAETLEEIKQQ